MSTRSCRDRHETRTINVSRTPSSEVSDKALTKSRSWGPALLGSSTSRNVDSGDLSGLFYGEFRRGVGIEAIVRNWLPAAN